MAYFYKIFFILKKCLKLSLFFLLIMGCCQSKVTIPVAHSACCVMSQKEMNERERQQFKGILQANQIGVATLGETKRIIIPESSVFYPYSSNLLPDQRNRLITVSKLISSYDVVLVKIDAYADNQFPESIAQSLTDKQAKIVSDYLKLINMDARIIINHGHGSENPVASNLTPEGQCFNRRVEITFRVYPFRPMY